MIVNIVLIALSIAGSFSSVTAWVVEMENKGLYQGDMILTPSQMQLVKEGKYTFGSIKDKLWPRTIAYDYDYQIGKNQVAVAAIQHAIMDYERYTCLRFKRRTTERTYMYFYQGRGCASYVGMSKGFKNKVSLGVGCWNRATALHEIGHSLGFHHEQSRPDRDKYLKIHFENIPKSMAYNFNIAKNIDSRGTPYDYRSIMHYSKTAFGGGKITMETIDPYYTDLIGTGQGFSAMDIKQINLVYGCPPYRGPRPPEPTPECHDSTKYCEMYAVAGRCKEEFIKKYRCRYTCRQCKLAPGTHPPIATRPPVTTMATAPLTTELTTRRILPDGPNCKDSGQVSNCKRMSRYCLDKTYHELMKEHCRRSCGFCKFSKTTAAPNYKR